MDGLVRQALRLACWEPGHDLAIDDGLDPLPQLAAGAQIYASSRLRRRILAAEDETLCQSQVVCRAANVIVLREPGGRQDCDPDSGSSKAVRCVTALPARRLAANVEPTANPKGPLTPQNR